MPSEFVPLGAAEIAQVDPELKLRLQTAVASLSEESGLSLDPTIIDTLISTLLQSLITQIENCFGGQQVSPPEAVARVKNMGLLTRATLQSRATNAVRMKFPGAQGKRLAAIGISALEGVARKLTEAEQLALAQAVLPMATDDTFTMI